MQTEPTPPNDPGGALIPITHRPDVVFTRGEGSWLWDNTGKRYLDFVQGWAVNCLGHCPAVVAEALAEQSRTLMNCSPAYYSVPLVDYARALTAASGLARVFPANSGAEANEGAIKLARKWGALNRNGAFEIITTHHAFHGRTLATMSASGKAGWDALFEPKVPGFPKVPLNDLAAVEAAITERTVAVMLEPIQGEAGVWPATDDYLRGLRALTEERNILLILDEIQTGMGRTGELFAWQHPEVRPDIMTLGKGIGAGVPLAALLAREEVCCFEPGDQGGTYNGNPLMAAVGLAVLRAVTAPGFLDGVVAAGARLAAGLEALSARHGLGGVRGRGLLLALDLGSRKDAAAIAAAALDRGLLLNAPRPDALRFMPALTVTGGEIDAMLEILDGLLR
ncbi:MAG: acetylornithine transaminase [Hyphomicrobiales bacterium]|nr:acetylornithine transaminase [Hyphomicrobiales bacterium]